MPLTHTFTKVSGLDAGDFHAIGLRHEGESFDVERCESWLFRNQPSNVLSQSRRTWLTGLWVAPEGPAFVTDAVFRHVAVHRGRDTDWSRDTFELPATLEGVWGVDERCAWAWGQSAGDPVMYRWDGDRWSEAPTPGEVLAMHGLGRDLVIAVGVRGLVARWDGARWTRLASPTERNLASVFVASESEVWASGPTGGLLAGTVEAIEPAGFQDETFLSLAKWRGDLWAGVNRRGLCRVEDGALVVEKPALTATSIDARRDLVIASPGGFAGTRDGKAWRGYKRESFEQSAAKSPPAWTLVG